MWRANLQLALLPAGMWSDRLQAAPGRDAPRDRWFTDLDRIQDERVRAMTNIKIALKIKMKHLEFGCVLDFGSHVKFGTSRH